jgi:hypothetical protein
MRTHRLLQHVEQQSKHNTPHLTINLSTNSFNHLDSTKLQTTPRLLHPIASRLHTYHDTSTRSGNPVSYRPANQTPGSHHAEHPSFSRYSDQARYI